MFQSKMIEQQKDFSCANKHNLPIMSVILNQTELSFTDRLLCSEQLIGFNKAIQLIDDQQSQKLKFIENLIETNIQEVDGFLSQISMFKSQIVQQLEYLNSMSMQYMLGLKQIGTEYSNYSFSSGLNVLINKEQSALDYEQLMKDINKIFNIWYQKANPKIQQFKSFDGYNKFEEILDKYLELHQKQQAPTKGTNFTFVQIQNNTQNFQEEWCGAIAINNDNSVVAAGCKKDIKIFEFKQGIMKCVQLLKEHKNDVNTLNFLKTTQPQQLISGGDDDTIIIWTSTIPWYSRLCFINNNIFTVQPYEGKYMWIFELNEYDKYVKTRDLAVKGDNEVGRAFFPQQYISQKKLLINKNGYHINLICYDNSGEFILVQSIDLGEIPYGQLYGTLSDNGQYIITWDRKSKEFQIREYQFT